VNGYRLTSATALLVSVLACAAAVPGFAAGSPGAPADPFKRGSQWMSLRAGYAKATGEVAADGSMGCGFGYRRFVLDGWAFGGFVQYDVLGRFGSAAEISVPMTLEVTRHARWGSAFHPYVGIGAGAYYFKQYRTGADNSSFTPGRYLTFGAQTPVRAAGLLGIDVRMSSVDRPDANPVFPGPASGRDKLDDLLIKLRDKDQREHLVLFSDSDSKSRVLWSVKIDYSISY
jgi:hypothetical protein